MKKSIGLILVLVYVLGLIGCSATRTKPYKDLNATEVLSAKVHLIPPDKTIQIEDINELVKLLNDVLSIMRIILTQSMQGKALLLH